MAEDDGQVQDVLAIVKQVLNIGVCVGLHQALPAQLYRLTMGVDDYACWVSAYITHKLVCPQVR